MRSQGALQTLLGLDFKISAECFRKPVLDFALVPVEKLGHPLEGISVENTAHIDMKFLGLELISREDTMEVAGIMFGSDDIAVQSIYQGNGQQVYLTIVRHYLPEASAAVIASNQNSKFDIPCSLFISILTFLCPNKNALVLKIYNLFIIRKIFIDYMTV